MKILHRQRTVHKAIDMPPVRQVGATFKKAPKAKTKGTKDKQMDIGEDGEGNLSRRDGGV